MSDRAIIVSMYWLYKKALLFVALFIIFSGLVGYWVIGTSLLYPFYFYIYGNMGKVLLVTGVAFIYLVKSRLSELQQPRGITINFKCLLFALTFLGIFYYVSQYVLVFKNFADIPIFAGVLHLTLYLTFTCLVLSVFPYGFIKQVLTLFKRELIICFGLAVGMYLMIFQIWKLWPYLSRLVLHAVYNLLSLTFSSVTMYEPLILRVNNFSILVGQACSGIDSLFLFTSLYCIFGIVDYKQFNHKRLVLAFIPALLGLFGVNILRIYLLMLIGTLVSPHLALGLFHTYAGLILFMVYFLVFWKLSLNWLKTK